jgi:transcriptional regulator with XRE-family HTH domain
LSKFKIDIEAEMKKRSGEPRDAEIGRRVRTLRLQRGLSQTKLGDNLGLTFQQVQKYEKGVNRISAGRLQKIAEVLDAPITFFYAGHEENRAKSDSVPMEFEFLQTGDAVRLVHAYSRIKHRGVQQRLVRLTETLAGE